MDIIAKALEQAERILQGVRANYIIVMPDGETRTRGDLKLATPEAAPKRKFNNPRGTLKKIYGAPLEALKPGEVWKHKPDSVTATELRASAGSYAAGLYGRENIMTTVDAKTNTLEVLRLA